MEIPPEMRRLKGFRSPREIVAYAVWAYYRFALGTADVEVSDVSACGTDLRFS